MKISSNKTKSKSKSSHSNKSKELVSSTDMSSKPSFRVETIDNGFIVSKTWTDKNGKYCESRKYHETNPLEENEKEESDED